MKTTLFTYDRSLSFRWQKLLLFSFLFSFFTFKGYSQQTLTKINGWNAYVHLPDDYASTGTQTYPAIFFFPGTGEVGTNAAALLNYGPSNFINSGWNGQVVLNGVTYKPIIISLQPPALYPNVYQTDAAIQAAVAAYRIDPKRISLTGLSHGGWMSEMYAMAFPNKIASVVAVTAVKPDDNPAYPTPFATFAQDCGHYLGYEQINDFRDMQTIANTMSAAVPGSGIYIQTNVGGGGHCCWNTWYNPTNTQSYKLNGVAGNWTMYQFMMAWSGCTAVNLPPTAGAGSAQTITLPTSSVTLTGTAAGVNGATISSTTWSQTSGPAGATITTPGSLSTTVTGLAQGTYVFTLTAKDNNGLSSASTVTITVNPAPVVNQPPTVGAGSAQTIALPTSSVTLTGTAAGVNGATISSTTWTQTSGAAATITTPGSLSTTVTGLAQGTYVFTLTAKDNNGLTSTSTVTITVDAAPVVNQPPTVGAGSAQTIALPTSSVTLTGTAAGVNGSTISSTTWSQTSGPSGATITTPGSLSTTVTGLAQGTYVFTLTALDNNGLTSTSTVTITVNSAPVVNQPPTVAAGSAQTIALPASSVTLTGTAAGMNGATISSTTWTKTSGPAATITTPGSMSTTVTGLTQGTYVFTFTAVDNNGVTSTSTVTITVNAAAVDPNNPCGCDITLTPNPSDGQVYVDGQTLGVKPGYKVCLKATHYVSIALFHFYGTKDQPVTIINCGGVTNISGYAGYGFFLHSSRYVHVTGTGDPSNKYGILIDGSVGNTQVGYGADAQSSDIESDHMEVTKTGGIGIATAPTPNCDSTSWASTWKMYNMSYHDLYVHDTYNEGFYLGNTQNYYNLACSFGTVTVEPQRFDTLRFYNNIMDKCGWSSAQISRVEGYADIHDNLITNFGYANMQQHQAGIILGGISHGRVYNNRVIKGTGNAFELFGSGLTVVSNNVFAYAGYDGTSQGQNTVMMDDRPAPPGFPGLKVYFVNNTIVSPKRVGISFYNDYRTVDTGNIIANNIIANPGFLPYPAAYIDTQASPHARAFNNLQLATNAGVKFVDSTSDFHILANSPAVDKGMDAASYGVSYDMDHNKRPYGSAYDIGAYEYNGGVQPPPVANAGGNKTMSLPATTTILNGSQSVDPAGTITTYAWTQVSGPNTATIASPSAVNTNISGLAQGTYKFALTVTDDRSLSDADTMVLTVYSAPPPVANAGSDITITLPTSSATLSGSKSTDAGGTITGYQWVLMTGPSTPTIATPSAVSTSVSGLVQGTYTFRLTVTDNNAVSAMAYVKVNVVAAPPPPTANAGSSITITLPVNSANLTGSGSASAGSSITAYAWSQVSGPNTAAIASVSAPSTTANNLVAGTYVFSLKVTDNNGLSGSATVTVIVKPAAVTPPPPPTANAGSQITITLPVNSATLNGSGSASGGGSITGYAWTQVSGPNTATIGSASAASTTVGNMVAGTYVFSLKVTDNSGLSGSATVKVVVNPAAVTPPAGQAPVANAGNNITITLPINSATLSGSGTASAGSSITGYAWTQVSGPNTATIGSASAASTTVGNLVAGTYVFSLKVTDNSGLSGSATVNVVVNPAAVTPPPAVNQPPVANAGPDQHLSGVTSADLDGSASYDPDGTIVSYSWMMSTGAAGVSILNANTAKPSLVGLKPSTYTLQLTVTDNEGATASASVHVYVEAGSAPAGGPVANAGKDTTIQYPQATSVVLDGGASYDQAATISTYSWKMVGGPGAAVIATPGSVSTSVSNLAVGIYTFALTVTDVNNNSSTDTVQVQVLSETRQSGVTNIYPNPVADYVTVDVTNNQTGKMKVSILDISGKLIKQVVFDKETTEFKVQIDASSLQRGVYLLTIQYAGGGKPSAFKMVKQ